MTSFLLAAQELGTALVTQAAEGEGGNAPTLLDQIIQLSPFILMFGVIYLLLIRPANKQRREHAEMLNQLKKDDEVVTNGGIYGKIVALDDKVATLEIADKVKIRIMRDRIAGRWNPQEAAARK